MKKPILCLIFPRAFFLVFEKLEAQNQVTSKLHTKPNTKNMQKQVFQKKIDLIQKLYTAFADAEQMINCCAVNNITFCDPVFGTLNGNDTKKYVANANR